MQPLLTDSQFNSLALVIIAAIGIVPATLAAVWSRAGKKTADETHREVMTNGGMGDPVPNLNDHIKYQTEMLEQIVERQDNSESLLANHIAHSKIMDHALAEVYLTVNPKVRFSKIFDEDGNPIDQTENK